MDVTCEPSSTSDSFRPKLYIIFITENQEVISAERYITDAHHLAARQSNYVIDPSFA